MIFFWFRFSNRIPVPIIIRRILSGLFAFLLLFGSFPLQSLAGEEVIPEEECYSPELSSALSAVTDDAFPESSEIIGEEPEGDAMEAGFVSVAENETGCFCEETATEDGSSSETFSIRIALSSIYENGSVLLQGANDSYEGAVRFDSACEEFMLPDTYDLFKSLVFETMYSPEDSAELLYYSGEEEKTLNLPPDKKTVPLLKTGLNSFRIVWIHGGENTEYRFTIRVLPTLSSLTVKIGETSISPEPLFSARQCLYSLLLPDDTESISIFAIPKKEDYSVLYNGREENTVDIHETEAVTVSVVSGDIQLDYVLSIRRVIRDKLFVEISPPDAVVKIYDKNGRELEEEDGFYHADFSDGLYTFSACCYGYIAQRGTVPKEGGILNLSLEIVQEREERSVSSEWSSFRNSDGNMGITDLSLPTEEDAESVSLIWNRCFGNGWENAPSVQIIVDNALVVLCGKTIYKLGLESGEILMQGEMAEIPNWGYTPPTYAEGMIIAPLNGGVIQAFDARTLESCWIYRDPLGGQSLSPISYAGGYLYTGFWNGETAPANYVCLSVTDEDPSNPDEQKTAVWYHTETGGFYWAGSVIVGNAVIVGTGDGHTVCGSSYLLSLNRRSGKLISRLTLENMGDQRSSIAYDSGSGKVFFTTQQGYFCSADIDRSTGKLSGLRYQKNEKREATATPIIYGNRAYYGVGSGISTSGSTGEFVVARADTLEKIYSVPLRGYPQCSQLMSTSHISDGYLYFYTTYNSKPGGITLIRIDPSADTSAGAQTWELYNAEGFEEYCIASLICGSDGTLYYKNDSGNVLAVGLPTDASVSKLIAAIIEPVSIEQEGNITAARAAYDKLSAAAKQKISNYSKLTAAETAIAKIKAKIREVEEKINGIGTVDGGTECRKRITAARKAYDGLTPAERAKVGNYSVLTAAENKLKSLNSSGSTKTISNGTGNGNNVAVTIGGIRYTVQRSAAELMQRIEALSNSQSPEEAEIIAVRTAYEALDTELKAQVFNYADLEKVCNALAAKYQRDDATGIYAEGLPWDTVLSIRRLENGETYEQFSARAAAFSGNRLLGVWQIAVYSLLDHRLIPDIGEYLLYFPLCGMEDGETVYVQWLDINGIPMTLECSEENDYAVVTAQNSGTAALIGESAMILPELDEAENVLQEETDRKPLESGIRNWILFLMVCIAVLGCLIWLRWKAQKAQKTDHS